jgi:adenine-specific DNA methylase
MKKVALLQASNEVDIEVNTHKTKYMVVSHNQNTKKILQFTDCSKILSKCGEVKVFGNNSNKLR